MKKQSQPEIEAKFGLNMPENLVKQPIIKHFNPEYELSSPT